MENEYTLIDETLSMMSEKANLNASIAKVIQNGMDLEPDMRIADAYCDFRRQRDEAQDFENDTGVRGDDPIAKPEYMMTFVQAVQNRMMWNARRLHNQIVRQEEFDNDTSGGTGQDFANDLCEEWGLPPLDLEGLENIVNADFEKLAHVHSIICSECNYLQDLPEFHFFVRTEPNDEGEWVDKDRAYDYDSAINLLESISIELRANELADRRAKFRKAA